MSKINSFAVVMALLLVAVMSLGVMAEDSLVIQGSSTVLPIAQKTAEVYMEKNPGVNISVRGGGSGNGIAALIDGAVDIADSSRFIKEKEVNAAVKNGIFPVPHLSLIHI